MYLKIRQLRRVDLLHQSPPSSHRRLRNDCYRPFVSRDKKDHLGKATLSGVVLDRVILEAQLLEDALRLIEELGFDVIDVLARPEVFRDPWLSSLRTHVLSPALLVLVVDVSPWDTLKSGAPSLDARVDNHRLATLSLIDKHYRVLWDEQPGTENIELPGPEYRLVSWLPGARETKHLIERTIPEKLPVYAEAVRELEESVTVPFAVVKELSNWGTYARTILVDWGHGLAVCKVFKKKRERAYNNELTCYRLAEHAAVILAPLEIGKNWILLPYLEGYSTLRERYRNRLPLALARECIRHYRHINDLGYSLLDFGTDNVMVNSEGKLVFIDFECMFEYPRDSNISIYESPFVVGNAFFEKLRAESSKSTYDPFEVVTKTYVQTWFPLVGVDIRSLLDAKMASLVPRRYLHFGKQFLKNAVRTIQGDQSAS
jgi:hypothetical protein